MKQYLKDLHSLPHISTKDLEELITVYEITRSTSARNAIVEYYLPMIPQLLYKYHSCGISLDELVQISNIHLIEIIDALDHIEPSTLRRYVSTCIDNHVLNTIRHYKNQGFISRRIPKQDSI